MTKKIIGGIAAIAIVAAIALNVNISSKSNKFSDILLANVEALAQSDVGGCIGSNFQVIPMGNGEWHCINNAGNDCCPY